MAESTFLYETLTGLSFPTDPDPVSADDDYSVLRSHVTPSSAAAPPAAPAAPIADIPALDYFSLDVSPDDDVDEEKSSPVPLASSASRAEKAPRDVSESAWFRTGRRFKSPMMQLHKEILEFCDFVSPTPEEHISRSTAIQLVSESIQHIWPHCTVEVFGSYKTGLYLPTSDVDVVILNSNIQTPQMGLRALARELKQRNITKQMQVIAKARVPIIKFVEKQSGISFDISFDVDGGPKAANFIKDAVEKLPPLRPLCLVLKVFLQQRELNEVYSGGIGSYTLLAMLIAHLQMYWKGQSILRRQHSVEHNLGILLVHFFDLYGRKLNISDVGVSCNSASTFFKKHEKGFLNTGQSYLLSVEDPQAPDNDIGKGSYNFYQVRSAFSMAYSLLTNAKAINALGPHKSILGTIIRPDPVLLDRKGGEKGDLSFDSLLPGAGESLPQQTYNSSDMLSNRQFVDDEMLPRENLAKTDSAPSRKKKVSKAKHLRFADDESSPRNVESSEQLLKKIRGSKGKHSKLLDVETLPSNKITTKANIVISSRKKKFSKEKQLKLVDNEPVPMETLNENDNLSSTKKSTLKAKHPKFTDDVEPFATEDGKLSSQKKRISKAKRIDFLDDDVPFPRTAVTEKDGEHTLQKKRATKTKRSKTVENKPSPVKLPTQEEPSSRKKKASKARHLKIVDNEPSPSKILVEEEIELSSQKKRAFKGKHRLSKCDGAESAKREHKENDGSSRSAKKKKKIEAFQIHENGSTDQL